MTERLIKLLVSLLTCLFFSLAISVPAQVDNHTNKITIRNDRVFLLNNLPFFPIMVNNELGPDNYRCQLRKPDGSSWGFNVINLMTEVTWHFKKFGGYCPNNPDLDYCGSGYKIRDIISGDATTSPQYSELLGSMGWDIDWYTNANRIFNYLDKDVYVLADDYAFYPSTVDWFEQNGGCQYPSCFSDCDSIHPRFDQSTRNSSIDRIDSLAKLSNSRLIGFYGMDDPNMVHSNYLNQNEEQYFARFPQQVLDFQNTYDYAKSKYQKSIVMFALDVLYYPKAMNPEDPLWQDWNLVLNNWVSDVRGIVAASDVISCIYGDASTWASNWWLYPNENLAMSYPNHLEQTLFPRLINTFNTPKAVLGGMIFDEIGFAPNPPHLDAKTKWATYIGLEKGATGLNYFGWHKGHESESLNQIWNAVRNLVDTLVNVKQLDKKVFTKTNIGAVGHTIIGSSNPNVSYAVYQSTGWDDYYLLVTSNPNGVINEYPEPDNQVSFSSQVSDWKKSNITEVFSGNQIQVSGNGGFQYTFSCWGVALFHVKSNKPSSDNIPSDFYLNQNYPNPFNPSTKISYGLPQSSSVSIIVYNSIGQEVATLINAVMNAGNYDLNFFGTNFPSGIYFYKIRAGGFESSKKMVLVK